MKLAKPERLLVHSGIAILAFLLVWFQLNLLLLAFAGVLVAVLLEAMTSWVNHHTRLNGVVAYLAGACRKSRGCSGIEAADGRKR